MVAGTNGLTDGSKVVKPFHLLTLPGLPDGATKTKFKVHWKPIFMYLKANVAFELPRNRGRVTDVDINRIYEQCLAFLKENVSYCFASRRTNPTKWVLGTWSLKTRRSTILKKGTEADKAKLATATNRNQRRRALTQPGRQMAENPMYPYRQRQHVGRLLTQAVNDDHDEEENDEGKAFGDAFQDVELTAAAQAREQGIREVINAEL